MVLLAVVRRPPWRMLPVEPLLLTIGLGVLAAAASPHLGLDSVLARGDAAISVTAAGAAAAINNLPALLLAMPLLPRADGIWALLLGVNMGPAFVISGSLAGFLWRDTARMMGVPVPGRTYSRVGLRVGGPAFAAAIVTLLATNALLG